MNFFENIEHVFKLVKEDLLKAPIDSEQFLLAYLGYKQLNNIAAYFLWDEIGSIWESRTECCHYNFVNEFFMKNETQHTLNVEQTVAIFQIDEGLKNYYKRKMMNIDLFGSVMRDARHDEFDYSVICAALEKIGSS